MTSDLETGEQIELGRGGAPGAISTVADGSRTPHPSPDNTGPQWDGVLTVACQSNVGIEIRERNMLANAFSCHQTCGSS